MRGRTLEVRVAEFGPNVDAKTNGTGTTRRSSQRLTLSQGGGGLVRRVLFFFVPEGLVLVFIRHVKPRHAQIGWKCI